MQDREMYEVDFLFLLCKMLDNKIILSLILVSVVGIVVYLNIDNDKSTETFWNIPSRTWKVEKILGGGYGDAGAGNYAIQGNQGCGYGKDPQLGSYKMGGGGCSYASGSQGGYAKPSGGCGYATGSKTGGLPTADFFQTPNFQSILSPRFSNVNYGPNLRTQFPAYKNMGVPQDPLTSGDGIRVKNARIPLDPHNPQSVYSSYTNGNYKSVKDGVTIRGGDALPTSTLAEGSTSFLTADGEMKQPIVYDRYVYANRRSRLRGLGDPIRGDLPIVPATGNWFTPSVHPNIDLQAGAINVLAGVNNDTNHQLANLIYNSSGGGDTTIGGVNMANVNMSSQVYGSLGAAQGDVQMTSFP